MSAGGGNVRSRVSLRWSPLPGPTADEWRTPHPLRAVARALRFVVQFGSVPFTLFSSVAFSQEWQMVSGRQQQHGSSPVGERSVAVGHNFKEQPILSSEIRDCRVRATAA